jgi:hypothetical protein
MGVVLKQHRSPRKGTVVKAACRQEAQFGCEGRKDSSDVICSAVATVRILASRVPPDL